MSSITVKPHKYVELKDEARLYELGEDGSVSQIETMKTIDSTDKFPKIFFCHGNMMVDGVCGEDGVYGIHIFNFNKEDFMDENNHDFVHRITFSDSEQKFYVEEKAIKYDWGPIIDENNKFVTRAEKLPITKETVLKTTLEIDREFGSFLLKHV